VVVEEFISTLILSSSTATTARYRPMGCLSKSWKKEVLGISMEAQVDIFISTLSTFTTKISLITTPASRLSEDMVRMQEMVELVG